MIKPKKNFNLKTHSTSFHLPKTNHPHASYRLVNNYSLNDKRESYNLLNYSYEYRKRTRSITPFSKRAKSHFQKHFKDVSSFMGKSLAKEKNYDLGIDYSKFSIAWRLVKK